MRLKRLLLRRWGRGYEREREKLCLGMSIMEGGLLSLSLLAYILVARERVLV